MARSSATSGGFVLVVSAAALWGTDAVFRRGLALDLPSSTVVVYEHAILVALTLPLLIKAVRSLSGYTAKDWAALIVIGAGASAVATLMFTASFRYGHPTTPLLLQKLQPLVAIGGASLLLSERLLPRYGLYFVLAVAGAFLISFPDPTAVTISAAAPAILAVGAAALWGLGTVLGRHLTVKTDFKALTALRFAVGLPAAAAFVLIDQGSPGFVAVRSSDILPLLLLALIPGLLALLLYYRGLGTTPASLATLAELAFPLAAVTTNYLAFHIGLTATQWVGLAVLTGTITVMSLLSHRQSDQSLGVRVPGRPVVESTA